MRYFFGVIDNATGTATPEEMHRIDNFNARLVREDRLVIAGGLCDPTDAFLIDARSTGEHQVGLHHDGSEYISGFWILRCDQNDEAVALAREASRACGRKIEVRPFLGG